MLSFPESQIDRGGKGTKLPPSGPRFSPHFGLLFPCTSLNFWACPSRSRVGLSGVRGTAFYPSRGLPRAPLSHPP